MKFLCGNCKAKYQIADEKVSGRTLRMKCRRCGHDILIDGHSMTQGSQAQPLPAQRRSGSSASLVPPAPARAGSGAHGNPAPAARGATAAGLPRPAIGGRPKPPTGGLSAEFRRHVAAPPEVPQRTAPYDLWHVAIQDVPVGPMTRDELARKVDAGAVTSESLCWREGMDDWRPLGELPELAQLLRRSREGRTIRGHGRPPPTVPATSGSRAGTLPVEAEEAEEEGAEPTRLNETAGHAAAGSHVGPLPTAPHGAPTPVTHQTGEAAAPAKTNQGLTTGVAIGLLAGILLLGGPMLYRYTWGSGSPSPSASSEHVAPAVRPTPAPTPEPPVQIEPPSDDVPSKVASQGTRSGARAGAGRAKPEGNDKKPLSEEQRRLLERMGGGANEPDLSRVQANRGEDGAGGAGVGPALTPQQLTKVVQDNKTQLQRCYETALRAAGGKQEGALKISVSVVVGTSGATKSVSTQGDGLGNMTDCIRQSVKRWRFPPSGGESEFAFPLVFQPGA